MRDKDSLYRFTFEHTRVRGELVHLDASWQALLEKCAYPPAVRQVLGEAAAATVLLSATLKFKGALTLQLSGAGPMSLLVMQATSQRTLRGLAHWQGVQDTTGRLALRDLSGADYLQITIDPGADYPERYQSIVELHGQTLADTVEHYLNQSEQLPTRLWLAVSETRCAGLLLQRLPGQAMDQDAWPRSVLLTDTLTPEELLTLHAPNLLRRLYSEETIRLFEDEPVAFRCQCSPARVEDMLKSLGKQECRDIIQEQGAIDVTCEFCNAGYAFDGVDVERLFKTPRGGALSATVH